MEVHLYASGSVPRCVEVHIIPATHHGGEINFSRSISRAYTSTTPCPTELYRLYSYTAYTSYTSYTVYSGYTAYTLYIAIHPPSAWVRERCSVREKGERLREQSTRRERFGRDGFLQERVRHLFPYARSAFCMRAYCAAGYRRSLVSCLDVGLLVLLSSPPALITVLTR